MSELRLGNDKMPVQKGPEGTNYIKMDRYGITGLHHVLLEGSTYPPERRSSMAQSLGPLTAMLLMLRTPSRYRGKWEQAVKRACGHIPCIDAFKEVTRTQSRAQEVSHVVNLIANILLIITSQNAHRMNIPLVMLLYATTSIRPENRDEFLKGFNLSGRGGFFAYKICCGRQWALNGNFNDEEARQLTFHAIFGSFSEDLGILSQITDVGKWLTREEIGPKFRGATNSEKIVRFNLPKLSCYSRLCSAHHTQLLTGVFEQKCAIPVFSGNRNRLLSSDCYDQINKKTNTGYSAQSLPEIAQVLFLTLNELLQHVSSSNGSIQSGTVSWRKIDDLTLDEAGTEVDIQLTESGQYFLGKRQNV